MSKGHKSCGGCYWEESCVENKRCDDYTPLEEQEDNTYYNEILKENAEVYIEQIIEQNS